MKTFLRIIGYPIRFLLLIGGMFLYYLEVPSNWMVGFYRKTAYIKKGKCNQCGKCCQLLAIEMPGFFKRYPKLISLVKKWHYFRYRFVSVGAEGNFLLYKCTLPTKDHRCSIYPFRPRLCREYPKLTLYNRQPAFYDCGFYFVRRDGRPTFDKALHDAGNKKVKVKVKTEV